MHVRKTLGFKHLRGFWSLKGDGDVYQSVSFKRLLLKVVLMKPSVCIDFCILNGLWQRARHRKTSLELTLSHRLEFLDTRSYLDSADMVLF